MIFASFGPILMLTGFQMKIVANSDGGILNEEEDLINPGEN